MNDGGLMAKFMVSIEVWLKRGLVDAEGETVKEALNDLGYSVTSVRVGKAYKLILDAMNEYDAKRIADEICRRLLANPVKDEYVFRVEAYEV